MTTLVIDRLEVRYGAVRAVRDLSLSVAPGQIVGLIGPNGAGKSSTLHAVMGAAPISGGSVRLGERTKRAGAILLPIPVMAPTLARPPAGR